MNEPKIWVLVDDRVGNANQAIVLAKKIEESFEIKQIEYNFFSILPNNFFSSYPIHIKSRIVKELRNSVIPEIIISSGRRTASLALYLKKISQNNAKIIQIMKPGIYPEKFDLIILPQHDNYSLTLSNITRIIGALTDVHDNMQLKKIEFTESYPHIRNFIAVVIGGNTKNYKLTISDIKKLCELLKYISVNHSLPLVVTFSRRTPNAVKKYVKKKFIWPNICYDPNSNEYNPYPAMLDAADFIIATPDSISMCSEAAGTGKPIYIYSPENFKLKKHNFFIQQLVDLGIVRRLESNTYYLEKYEYKPLSEITKVVKIIRKNLL